MSCSILIHLMLPSQGGFTCNHCRDYLYAAITLAFACWHIPVLVRVGVFASGQVCGCELEGMGWNVICDHCRDEIKPGKASRSGWQLLSVHQLALQQSHMLEVKQF